MGSISAVIVTLNEQDRIRECLKTLSWCDEIILIDNNSSDDTVKIAQEFTDEIYQYETRHGYGDPLKKYGFEKASGDWILIIDADEMVPITLAQKLNQIVENSTSKVVQIPFKNYSLGIWVKGAGWWPDYHPRFFKRDAVNVTDDIHDFLQIENDSNVAKLPLDEDYCIRHFNHTNIEDKLSRINNYTTVESQQNDFSYYQLFLSPIIEFINRLVIKKGYRLGRHGLLLAIFQAWYQFLVAIKSWEIENIGGKEGIENIYDDERDKVINEWE